MTDLIALCLLLPLGGFALGIAARRVYESWKRRREVARKRAFSDARISGGFGPINAPIKGVPSFWAPTPGAPMDYPGSDLVVVQHKENPK